MIKLNLVSRAALFLLLGSLIHCAHKTVQPATPDGSKISMLTFNVENLFDDENDEEKNDEPYLSPEEKASEVFANRCRAQNNGRYMYECLEKDWSKPIVRRKLQRTADVVAQVNNGRGPDILILQEVENEKILSRWRDEFMPQMGYKTLVLIEGPDERGIDTAIMSRLPLVDQPKLHIIDFKKNPKIDPEDIHPTRGLLEAHLQLPERNGKPGGKLAVFAVHFPAQGADTIYRETAMRELMEVTAKIPPDTPIVVGGDFNITSKEDWKHKYFRDIAAKQFTVSHMVGCKKCAGSIYFPPDQTWSFFDVMLFSKDLTNGLAPYQLDADSIKLVNSSIYQTNRFGTPARFGSGKGTVGVSDHWPLYAELKLRPDPMVSQSEGVK